MHAFGVKPGEVRFVATSATIGKQEDRETREGLRRFLAQVAGLNEDQVVVVEGARRAPELPAQQSGLVLLTSTEIERLNLEEVNDRLGATPAFRRGLEHLYC